MNMLRICTIFPRYVDDSTVRHFHSWRIECSSAWCGSCLPTTVSWLTYCRRLCCYCVRNAVRDCEYIRPSGESLVFGGKRRHVGERARLRNECCVCCLSITAAYYSDAPQIGSSAYVPAAPLARSAAFICIANALAAAPSRSELHFLSRSAPVRQQLKCSTIFRMSAEPFRIAGERKPNRKLTRRHLKRRKRTWRT